MKFGFESEKLLYDLDGGEIYHGVFRLVDALSDYVSFHGEDVPLKITNEFVLNMVEMNTLASPSQREVLEDYLLLYQILRDVALRANVVPLPLAAVPFDFTPSMIPKWPYYVQNSILSGRRLKEWSLSKDSPLADAGNCAGLHVHFEIDTLPEFLMFSSELANKHNLALMLTPMIAFSSSPYFLSEHRAHSMRSRRYYYGVYAQHPLNGGLPPVFNTSEEVLRYTAAGMEAWLQRGLAIGFMEDDLRKLIAKKGANWSMLRWNRTWNTIELRCLESDRIDYDLGKFTWVAAAVSRIDPNGEALQPVVPDSFASLDEKLVDNAFQVKNQQVTILSTVAIHELTQRAVDFGLNDPLVRRYIERIKEFAAPAVQPDCLPIFDILSELLEGGASTSEKVLKLTKAKATITREECLPILKKLLEEENNALKRLRSIFPTVIPRNRSSLFPSFKA